jgi:hypothetical protein
VSARGNVNTIDEVPDSSCSPNRIGTRALPVDAVVRGPVKVSASAGKVDVTREKRGRGGRLHGPGRERADTSCLSIPMPANPEGGNRRGRRRHQDLLALGYNQVEILRPR